MTYDEITLKSKNVMPEENIVRVDFEGLGVCGCGGELVLYECPDKEFTDTFYIECDNKHCGLSVGRRYDPINNCRRGEFTDAHSAVEAANLAVGYRDNK